ncbi:MAG: type III polyketide synthase [Actinomycetes bacterium]
MTPLLATGHARIAGIGSALPAVMDQQGLWDDYFARHYARHPTAQKVWRSSGVRTRHGVLDPRIEDVSSWGTRARMERYIVEALPLGKDAVGAALDDAGVRADDVGMFVVASCTGYATPGLDILLARDLDMDPGVQRLGVGHMGCYAAVPALGAAADFVSTHGKPAVLLCCELPSLHVQPATDDVQQMVAHALFADAAAAVVLVPDGDGLSVLEVAAHTDAATSPMMTWDVTDLGFRMGLSPEVPDVLAQHVRPVVSNLLARHKLGVGDIGAWAVHPGGPRIVDVVAAQLELPADAVSPSRDVLRDHGNCSSATVLLVLDEVLRRDPSASPVVAMAFGPGLTLYAALLG